MYDVIFDPLAIGFLNRLEKAVRERIFKKIISTKENPFRYFERLEGRMDFKLRVGDYRVIADIDQTSNKIQITLIGHRKNIYKRMS
ncbi:MAG: type II toxin-antitoxin system RelE/ParE family toxin [Candidatus Aenigmarchaeota archaeon]|nr:type II toxin-antitoxin system RelE/ParE family toxin [Candidatus Aenigmarchaeota archaeon]